MSGRVHQVLATLGYGDAIGHEVLGIQRVLKGQCIRSNAGLYYENYEEFVEALYSLESNGPLNARLGRNGKEFFKHAEARPADKDQDTT